MPKEPTHRLLAQAEGLMAQLARTERELKALEAEAEKEIQEVHDRYGPRINQAKEAQKACEKDLVALMRKNKARIFDGTDQIDLVNGILLYGKEDKVTIPRDALEKIKAQGWNEAVKVTESVDRAVVEKWPVERLAVIGADRKPKESFTYDLKGCGFLGQNKGK
jgi:phage host-nuclease inhibitor protein Gam